MTEVPSVGANDARGPGGDDSFNLLGLCYDHHGLVHEGGWTILGDADLGVVFTSPDGHRRLTSRPHPVDPKHRQRAARAAARRRRAGSDTGTRPPTPPPG